MRLKAKVVGIQSGDRFIDNKERVELKFEEGALMFDSLKLPNDMGLRINDEVYFTVTFDDSKDYCATHGAMCPDPETHSQPIQQEVV